MARFTFTIDACTVFFEQSSATATNVPIDQILQNACPLLFKSGEEVVCEGRQRKTSGRVDGDQGPIRCIRVSAEIRELKKRFFKDLYIFLLGEPLWLRG
jgi:hypothetical protein